MTVLLDTNILLRWIQPAHPHHPSAVRAQTALEDAGHGCAISSQSVYEFLAVATRPVDARGLGMDHAAADAKLRALTATLDVFYDSQAIADEVRRMVVALKITGKPIHDARLVATLRVHGLDALLTFNSKDFSAARFPDELILDPSREPAEALVARLAARASG